VNLIGKRTVLVGLLGAILAIHALLFWFWWRSAAEGYADFTIFYTAGKLVGSGQGHRLYDSGLQFQLQQNFAPHVQNRKGALPYNHPAAEALIFVPLTWLDYGAAYLVWDLINLAILAILPILLRPHIPLLARASPLFWFALLLAYFPVLATLMQGQDAILSLLLYALAFAALNRNADAGAGFWLGLGMFRFHLILPLVLILLLCCKRKKLIPSFLLTVTALAAISIAITGWVAALQYPQYVWHLEQITGGGGIFPAVMPNLRGLLQGWSAAHEFPIVVQITVISLSAVLLFWVIRTPRNHRASQHEFGFQFSLATVTTLLISYHSYAYDLIVLAIPVLVILSYTSELDDRPWKQTIWLLFPIGVLFCTPLYIWLGSRTYHLNLLAIVLLFWLWAMRREVSKRLVLCET
jgi:hypothetical protein